MNKAAKSSKKLLTLFFFFCKENFLHLIHKLEITKKQFSYKQKNATNLCDLYMVF